jgi:hypothetical protein
LQRARGNETSDRVCRNITKCDPKLQYEEQPPNRTTDRRCKILTKCSTLQYQTVAPTPTSDRNCSLLTVCPTDQFEYTPATFTTDRVCRCRGDRHYFDLATKSCILLQVCNRNQRETVAPTLTSNRQCGRTTTVSISKSLVWVIPQVGISSPPNLRFSERGLIRGTSVNTITLTLPEGLEWNCVYWTVAALKATMLVKSGPAPISGERTTLADRVDHLLPKESDAGSFRCGGQSLSITLAKDPQLDIGAIPDNVTLSQRSFDDTNWHHGFSWLPTRYPCHCPSSSGADYGRT